MPLGCARILSALGWLRLRPFSCPRMWSIPPVWSRRGRVWPTSSSYNLDLKQLQSTDGRRIAITSRKREYRPMPTTLLRPQDLNEIISDNEMKKMEDQRKLKEKQKREQRELHEAFMARDIHPQ